MGNPNGAGLPLWPSYRTPQALSLKINVKSEVEPDLDGARHRFLATVR